MDFDKHIMTSIHHHSITENGLCPKLALRVCMRAKSLQLCPTLCNPMDCRPQAPLSMGIGTWQATVHGVAKSWTQLK